MRSLIPLIHIPKRCLALEPQIASKIKWLAVKNLQPIRESRRQFRASKSVSLWSNQLSEEARQSSPVQGHEKVMFKGSETSESKLFALGSSLATRLSTDREIECTEFDEKGEIVMGHGHIKKSDLVRKVKRLIFKRGNYANISTSVLYPST